MRKFLIASVIALSASTAQAQHRHHHHHSGGGRNWVAPLVGGVIAGGLLYGLSQPRAYAAPPVYVEQPRYRRECWDEPVYDMYGRWLGDRKTCRTVPIY